MILHSNNTEVSSGNSAFDDLSPMPFGKHKGTPMQDVPAKYLHWLWNNGACSETTLVANYIRSNMDALEMEYPDGIWEKGGTNE